MSIWLQVAESIFGKGLESIQGEFYNSINILTNNGKSNKWKEAHIMDINQFRSSRTIAAGWKLWREIKCYDEEELRSLKRKGTAVSSLRWGLGECIIRIF